MANSEHVIDLPVLGMTCAACVRRVERALLAVPGVASADVNLPLSRARIAGEVSSDVAAAAIRDAGYDVPEDATGDAGARDLAAIERAHRDETRGLKRDALLAIALTAPLIVIAMAFGEGTASVIAQLALGSIVVLVPGARYMRAGFAAVRHRSPDMNTLIALGAGTAWLSSLVAAVRWLAGPREHAPMLYFEAGAAIVAFVMIGKVLESRARSRIADAVRGLLILAPPTAHRIAEDAEHDVDAATLAAGDVIAVRPGERLPADGTVVAGVSAVDESLLTGESLPVDKAEGTPVYAGTLNHHGALTVRVARAGADTSLARIARAVGDAQGSKAPIARLADRVSAWFVPAVLAIAALTFAGWWLAGSAPSIALERMIAVLVIACPCALGLATPAAVAVGTARGAELGLLFRGGTALEVASTIRVVCLDKTGTLTLGKPALVGVAVPARIVRPAGDASISVVDANELLRLLASAEQASEHPIARAIVEGARTRGLSLERPSEATIEPGGGLRAVVANRRVVAGTRDFLALAGLDPSALDDPAATFPAATLSYVAIDGAPAGIVAVADPVRDDAAAVLVRLRALGIEPVMITGDRPAAAQPIADALGIERVHAAVKPTGKAAIVATERREHKVAMVGDGVNDAPALAAADLGIAVGSGTEIAAAAADVTLLRGGIANLPTAFELARATLHTIRRNLLAAFLYNAVCIPIAAAGLLSPVLAAAAMSLSSVSVLASSLRLRRFVT